MIKLSEPFKDWLKQYDISEDFFYDNLLSQQSFLIDPSNEQLIRHFSSIHGHNVQSVIVFQGKHKILENAKAQVNLDIVFPFAVKLFSAYSIPPKDFVAIIDAFVSHDSSTYYSSIVFSQDSKFTLDPNRKNEINKWTYHIIERLADPTASPRYDDKRLSYQPKIWDNKLDDISLSLAKQYFKQPNMDHHHYNSRLLMAHIEEDLLLGKYILIFERLLRKKKNFSFIELILFACLYTNTHHSSIATLNKPLQNPQDIKRATTWFKKFADAFFSEKLDYILKEVMLNQLLEDAQYICKNKVTSYKQKHQLPEKYKSRVNIAHACDKHSFEKPFIISTNVRDSIIEHQKYCISFYYIDMVLLVHLMQHSVISYKDKFYVNNTTYDFTDIIKNYDKTLFLYKKLSKLGFHFQIPWKIYCMACHINKQFQIILELIKKESVSLLEVLPESEIANGQPLFEFLKNLL